MNVVAAVDFDATDRPIDEPVFQDGSSRVQFQFSLAIALVSQAW